jgi:hypothetical protein
MKIISFHCCFVQTADADKNQIEAAVRIAFINVTFEGNASGQVRNPKESAESDLPTDDILSVS